MFYRRVTLIVLTDRNNKTDNYLSITAFENARNRRFLHINRKEYEKYLV